MVGQKWGNKPHKWKYSPIGGYLDSGDPCCCADRCGCFVNGDIGDVVVTFNTVDCAELDGIQFILPQIVPYNHWVLQTDDDPCFGDAVIEVLCTKFDVFGTPDPYSLTVRWLPNPNPVPCFNTPGPDPAQAEWSSPTGTCDPFYLEFSTVLIFANWTGTAPPGPYDCCACPENYNVYLSATVELAP